MVQMAMKIIVDEANNHSQHLNGSQLLFTYVKQSVHQVFSVVIDFVEREVVAIIIKRQTYGAAAIVATDLREAAKAPVLSLSSSSPLLSNRKFPYFVRLAHNDGVQSKANPAIVIAFGSRRIIFLHSARYKDGLEKGYWVYISLTSMLSLNPGEKRDLDLHRRTKEPASVLYSFDTTGRS